jgi:hypothetical protein
MKDSPEIRSFFYFIPSLTSLTLNDSEDSYDFILQGSQLIPCNYNLSLVNTPLSSSPSPILENASFDSIEDECLTTLEVRNTTSLENIEEYNLSLILYLPSVLPASTSFLSFAVNRTIPSGHDSPPTEGASSVSPMVVGTPF